MMWRETASSPRSRRVADLCVPVLYLAALPIPPIGSTLVWALARVVTREPSIDHHYVRALWMQLLACAAIAGLQASVAGVFWLSGPALGAAPHEALRVPLLTADAVVTCGLLLTTAILGPALLVAEVRDGRAHGHVNDRRPLRLADVSAAAPPAAPSPSTHAQPMIVQRRGFCPTRRVGLRAEGGAASTAFVARHASAPGAR